MALFYRTITINVAISGELRQFIRDCFTRGGNVHLRLADIDEWAVDLKQDAEVIREIESLRLEHGNVELLKSDYILRTN
jgi:hypothetical protein